MKTNYVIGDPVRHSLSPLLHNEAYRQLGINDKYVFKAERVDPDKLAGFMQKFRDTESDNGLAVTIPHKQIIIKLLDEVDEAISEIGAVNTIVKYQGKLKGYNTDWLGVAEVLKPHLSDSIKVAILGTGGTARAVAYAAKQSGAQTTIFGRDHQKAIAISKEFGAMPADIEAKKEIANHHVIVNATSVGLKAETDPELIPDNLLDSYHVVFDVVYGRTTKLIEAAHQAGATVYTGVDLLVAQAVPQIELHTGVKPDIVQLSEFVHGTVRYE